MQVSTICRRDIVTIDAQRTLIEAARMMRDHHVGMLVVTCADAQGEQVCGLVTDRDLVIDALARTPLELDAEVGDLAHVDLTLIAENASLDQAASSNVMSQSLRISVSSGVRGPMASGSEPRANPCSSSRRRPVKDFRNAGAPWVALSPLRIRVDTWLKSPRRAGSGRIRLFSAVMA